MCILTITTKARYEVHKFLYKGIFAGKTGKRKKKAERKKRYRMKREKRKRRGGGGERKGGLGHLENIRSN